MTEADLLARLERYERGQRRLRLLVVGVLSLPVIGAIAAFAAQRKDADMAAASLRVREIVVVDSHDVVRVRIGGHLPDAVIDGRPLPRGDRAAGVLLYDHTGRERGGYVTFERNGHVALTLDTRERQVALFAAGPEDGAVARIGNADGTDWVELRAGGGGAHLKAGRDGALVYQEPPLVEPEVAAFCADFMGEMREIEPPPSEERILGICSRHMPGEVCRRCLETP